MNTEQEHFTRWEQELSVPKYKLDTANAIFWFGYIGLVAGVVVYVLTRWLG
jgi:hypothetical protein